MDKFLPFLDLFELDSVKVEVSKAVMSAFCTLQKETTSDPVILNSMMYIGKVGRLVFLFLASVILSSSPVMYFFFIITQLFFYIEHAYTHVHATHTSRFCTTLLRHYLSATRRGRFPHLFAGF